MMSCEASRHARAISRPRRRGSWPRSNGGGRITSAPGGRSRRRGGSRSSSTTGSRRAPGSRRRYVAARATIRRGSSSRCRWRRRKVSPSSGPSATISSASRPPTRSMRWARITAISGRPKTRRSSACSKKRGNGPPRRRTAQCRDKLRTAAKETAQANWGYRNRSGPGAFLRSLPRPPFRIILRGLGAFLVFDLLRDTLGLTAERHRPQGADLGRQYARGLFGLPGGDMLAQDREHGARRVVNVDQARVAQTVLNAREKLFLMAVLVHRRWGMPLVVVEAADQERQ